MKWMLFRWKGYWHLAVRPHRGEYKTRCGVGFAMHPQETSEALPMNTTRVCASCATFASGGGHRRRVEST